MARSKRTLTHGPYFAMPHIILDHPDFFTLNRGALRVLFYLMRQYKPGKNGDLSASWTDMQKRGIGSEDTLSKAIKELIDAGWIVRTRTGRFINPGAKCHLYALTWHPIDACPGKDLEIGATITPMRKLTKEVSKTPSTETVGRGYRNCRDGDENTAQK